MVVSWLTRNATQSSTVTYWPTASPAAKKIANGTSRSYYKSFNHDVVLEELVSSTEYNYIVGGGTGQQGSFTTPPAAPASLQEANALGPWTAVLYGDMGVTNSENTTKRLKAISAEYDWVYVEPSAVAAMDV